MKCFISYAHVTPDIVVAQYLEKSLVLNGHKVFIDSRISPGLEWPNEIVINLNNSDCFIVLLSQQSILSDMVLEEIKRAHERYRKEKDFFYIIPIRLDYTGSLPYDLSAYLNRVQYIQWNSGDDPNINVQKILEALENRHLLFNPSKEEKNTDPSSRVKELFNVTEKIGAPLLCADLRMPQIEMETGTISLDSPFYVERESDTEMKKLLNKTGVTVIVKGARQMGKSSLLARAKILSQSLGHLVFYLDFQSIEKSFLLNLDKLCQYIAWELYEILKLQIKPSNYWKKFRGPMQNLTRYIEEALLEPTSLPATFLLDEVDRLFELEISDDFFSSLRSWHNARATDERNRWKRFNIVLAHSTEPYLWIKDMNRSPFNVGVELKMMDFEKAEIVFLNQKYNCVLKTESEIEQLLDFTGGQPYIVRFAFYNIVSAPISLNQLEKKASEEDGPFSDHLRRFLWWLKDDKGMMSALREVLEKGKCTCEEKFLRLRAGGLVKGNSRHQVAIRSRLYKDYFKRHL